MRSRLLRLIAVCVVTLGAVEPSGVFVPRRDIEQTGDSGGILGLPRAIAGPPPIPTETFTPIPTSTPTPTPTLRRPNVIYQQDTNEWSEVDPDNDIDGIGEGNSFWVYAAEADSEPDDYTFYRKLDPGGYSVINPSLQYRSTSPLKGFYFSQPDTLSPGQYYYKVEVDGAALNDEGGPLPTWRGGIVIQTNTPTPTKTSTPTNTPLRTPFAVYQYNTYDYDVEPTHDIDGIGEGNAFWVYAEDVSSTATNEYTFYRKVDAGGYSSISPSVDYRGPPLEGLYFSQPDTLSPGHYYYKVEVQGSVLTDEDGAEDWRGGIVVQTNTPTPTNTSTPTNTPLRTPFAIYQYNTYDYDVEPTQDIDGIGEGNPFWVYAEDVSSTATNEYTFHRKVDAGGYSSITPSVDYRGPPLEGLYFSQPDTLSPGHYYYKVEVQGSVLTDEDGAEDWRGGIVVQTNTPTPTFTQTYTPTPLPTPFAIYQSTWTNLYDVGQGDPDDMDIDEIAEGNSFRVYIQNTGDSAAYSFYRKTGLEGSWGEISQTPDYDPNELQGAYFSEPNTIAPGHYYYKVDLQGATRSDEPGVEDWRGGILVLTNTPTPTYTPTPTNTFLVRDFRFIGDEDSHGGADVDAK